LESARLLLPDTKDRQYRPKLTGWVKKRAYLFREEWEIKEIPALVKGQCESGNPKEWFPVPQNNG
jgi:hypothetical protein